MSDFELGDKVEYVGVEETRIIGEHIHDRGNYVVEPLENDHVFDTPSGNEVEWIDGGYEGEFSWVKESQITLIEEGEYNMSNLEAIAVVGDRDLKRTLMDIAEDNEFNTTEVNTTNVFYSDVPTEYEEGKKVTNTDSDYKNGSFKGKVFNRVDEDKREVLALPEDWDRAKAFVTQEVDVIEPFEINGREVEIDVREDEFELSEVSVGCYTTQIEHIRWLKCSLQELEVDDAEFTIQGETFDDQVLFDLVEWIDKHKEND